MNPVPVTWGGGQDLEPSQPSPPPFTSGAKEYGLHFAADAAPDDAARGITGGVGMFNGGAIITISTRQHLASPGMHAYEVLAAGTVMHKIHCTYSRFAHRMAHISGARYSTIHRFCFNRVCSTKSWGS